MRGLIFAVVLQLAACASYPLQDERPDDPAYAPVITAAHKPEQISTGSLFRSSANLDLYVDRRAYGVGDIITVMLNERTVSSKSAETTIDKDAQIDIAEDIAFGNVISLEGNTMLTDIDQTREFEGSGETDQENSLTGSIAVTVSNVMPNGLLEIRGEKWMTLTTGEEFIRITGLVRPDDISASNSVPSTRVANARISYSGTGELADANRQGWGSRFLNSRYWPF
jgi:flagellar L-ring protein precursor FlgH